MKNLIYSIEKDAFKLIREHYYGAKTVRSGMPLINHITEGIEILQDIEADPITIAAYCLHPLVQDDKSLVKSLDNNSLKHQDPRAIQLAMLYRQVANSYLCGPAYDNKNKPVEIDFIVPAVKQMLIADKLQNEKDFYLYHNGTHKHSKALITYFANWRELLDLNKGVCYE